MVGCDPAAPGGISKVIHLLLHGPLAASWELIMVPTWIEGSQWDRSMVYARALTRIWTLAATGRLQAVHLHMAARGSFWRKWFLGIPLPWLGVRVIVHIHDGTLPQWCETQSRFTLNRLRRFLEQSDAVVALSPSWLETLKPLATRARWAVMGNPVTIPAASAVERQPHDPDASRVRGDRPEGAKVILFLGRLRQEKGLEELLSAALELERQGPHAVWRLAGDGDLAALRRRLSDLGLTPVVDLLGWLNDREKAVALAAADVLVLPSHAEGQPLAVLEAMAWGIPVVASDVGDIPELLAGGAGLVFPRGDAQAFMQAVRQVLQDPQRARRMGTCGRRHVMEHHSVERISFELDALYRRLGLSPTARALHSVKGLEA